MPAVAAPSIRLGPGASASHTEDSTQRTAILISPIAALGSLISWEGCLRQLLRVARSLRSWSSGHLVEGMHALIRPSSPPVTVELRTENPRVVAGGPDRAKSRRASADEGMCAGSAGTLAASGADTAPDEQPGPGRALSSEALALRRGSSCPGSELNQRHADFQSAALPTELPGRVSGRRDYTDGSYLATGEPTDRRGIFRASWAQGGRKWQNGAAHAEGRDRSARVRRR